MLLATTAFGANATKSSQALKSLSDALKLNPNSLTQLGSKPFAKVALSEADATTAAGLIWDAHRASTRAKRIEQMKAKQIVSGDKILKFEALVFGEKPKSGRSLFISLHGGGGAPPRVNDQQWRNQIRLYRPKEGIYVAPRAPTDTWNLWHQSHIDGMFDRLIENFVILAEVNPDRVYVMGYSAGGDGVYQLAPRMADRWAAAAMMAGHPNDASPLGLRNIGFALHVGALDGAYKRNQIGAQWGKRLDQLQAQDPKGYKHQVKIHAGKGHWMDRQDAVAVEWMAGFTRNPYPTRVIWVQDDAKHSQFYWMRVTDEHRKKGATISARRKGQVIDIDQAKDVSALTILLNDQMVELDQLVEIKRGGKTLFRGVVPRTIKSLLGSLLVRRDRRYLFPAEISISFDE
jgi:hypothetical protein